MFPTQSKVNRVSRLWLLPVVALAMLLVGYAVFAASTAQAQTVAGEFCIEGIVIDWEEKPLAGWEITLTADITIPGSTPPGIGGITTTVSAPAPEEDDDVYGEYGDKGKTGKKYNFEYPESDSGLQKGEFEFQDLLAASGQYTAGIVLMPGWEGVTPEILSFPIEVGEDDCVQIRFKVRRIVPVTVYKIDADHEPLGDWKIRAIPGPGNLFASPQEEETEVFTITFPITGTDGISPTTIVTGGTAVFTLTPGLWIFTEQAPKQDMDDPQESYIPVVPPNGRQELLIPDDIDATETFTVVFKNELVNGCFIVQKNALVDDDDSPLVGGFGVAGWGFKLLRADGTVARQGVTDGRGQLRFDNLPLGPYTLVEEDRPGWEEITAEQLDINVTGNMCDEGDPVVEFINEQDESGFCIEGRKIDANGGYGIPGWEITIEALDEGGALPVEDISDPDSDEIDTTLTDGLGEFRFDFLRNDYRVPGARYEVCESEQDGWLPHNPTCQTVRLPEWPGACVQLADFVNQQVGHSESQDKGKPDYDKGGKGDDGKGGPEYGDGPGQGNGPEYGDGPSRGDGPEYGNGDSVCSTYHVVKAGEGLYDIGRNYNRTPQQMLDANPDVKKGEQLWVYEGQRICIP